VLKPLMLRRMKEDVETTIPMKEETVIEVELTMTQKRYYRAILEKNLEFLARKDCVLLRIVLNLTKLTFQLSFTKINISSIRYFLPFNQKAISHFTTNQVGLLSTLVLLLTK